MENRKGGLGNEWKKRKREGKGEEKEKNYEWDEKRKEIWYRDM